MTIRLELPTTDSFSQVKRKSSRIHTPLEKKKTRVIRTGEFAARALAIEAGPLLEPLLREFPQLRPEAWISAFAGEMCERAGAALPSRWLAKLTGALQVDCDRLRLPENIFGSLPPALFTDSTVLSVLYSAALRNTAVVIEPDLSAGAVPAAREGRAGRRPEGCVYTPPAIAREIVGQVHTGSRRSVDPACGAGIFLIEAFKRAFARRLENGGTPQKSAEDALVHEIAGIDIDEKALAIAEFALRMQAFFSGGLDTDVPVDLRHADALAALPDLEGQCDVVVGNPPFVEGRGLSRAQLKSLRGRFASAGSGKINLFAVFVERALSLLKDGGVMAFVVPVTFQRNSRYKALRELLLRQTIEAITPLDANLFGGRIVETCVLRVRKTPPSINALVSFGGTQTPQSQLSHGPVLRFCNAVPAQMRRQIAAMEKRGTPLGECFGVRDGISTGFQPFPKRLLGEVKEGVFVAQDGTMMKFDPGVHKPIVDGFEFNAFTPIHWSGRYIDYDKEHEHFPPHPGRPFNCQLRDATIYDRAEKLLTRQTAKGLIATIDRKRYFVRNSVHVTFHRSKQDDIEGRDFDFAREEKLTRTKLSLAALCACLNTRLYSDYLVAVTGENGVVFPQIHIADLRTLPLLPGLLEPGGELALLGEALLDMHRQSIAPSKDIQALLKYVQSVLEDGFGIAREMEN